MALEENRGVGIFYTRTDFHPHYDHPSENPEPWLLDEPDEEQDEDDAPPLDSP